MNIFRKFLRCEKGQTALEYALVIAVVAAVIVGAAVAIFGDKEKGVSSQVFGKAVESVTKTLTDANEHLGGN